ncbi:MAG: hypothetical protein ACSLFC_09775 [Desulfuromonadales bacterium]
MKTLYLLIVILFCSMPLHAENVSILTELEQLQEKLWYLQRDLKENKASHEKQQKQLDSLVSAIGKESLQFQERLAASSQETANLQEMTRLLENDLVRLGEALIALTEEVRKQNSVYSDQAGRIEALEESMAMLLGERAAQKADTGQELSALRTQLAETRTQMDKARSQVDALELDVVGQIKQLGYWGAGVALVFFIALTFVIILCKNRERPRRDSHPI